MEIDSFLLADGAQAVGGKLYILGGGWNTIRIREGFPVKFPATIAISLRVDWNETNVGHPFAVKMVDLDGNVTQDIADGSLEVGRPPGLMQGSEQNVHLAIKCTLDAEEPVERAVSLLIDGEERRRVPFRFLDESGGKKRNE